MVRRVIQLTGYLFLSLLGVFLIYANAESKPAHAQVKAINMIVVSLENELTAKESQNLNVYLGGIPGVTAVQTSVQSKKVSVLFDKDTVSSEALISGIEKIGIDVKPVVFEKPSGNVPECPVPMKYVQKFEELKYAFNFRK
ncbi:MAG: heavy-metal-associated domain-containing protein [Spirosomataceae bacterium]